jgi:hypothetical protein
MAVSLQRKTNVEILVFAKFYTALKIQNYLIRQSKPLAKY